MMPRQIVMTWRSYMSEIETAVSQQVPVRYIEENFDRADRLAVVVLNKRTNAVMQRIATAEAIVEADFQAWLRYCNEQARSEIYISMNALHPEATGRTKQDVAAIRHVYLDFDEDGTTAVERLLKRQDIPQPNYLINTSPNKWQVLWKVDGFAKEEAEDLQRGLAREAGADPAATDCSRGHGLFPRLETAGLLQPEVLPATPRQRPIVVHGGARSGAFPEFLGT